MKWFVVCVFALPTVLAGTNPQLFEKDFKLNSCNGDARQFIRAAFHDAGTFDRISETGGADGSLQFELDRRENLGLDKIVEFAKRLALEKGASLADVLAYGAILSVRVCGGPAVPFRHGRIDATQANPTGRLAGPSSTAQQLRAVFVDRMGFTIPEFVALNGGGHTVARLRLNNNPGDLTVKPGPFDSTSNKFDNVFFRELLLNPADSRSPSDRNQLNDPQMRVQIVRFSTNQNVFFVLFARSMGKMINMGAQFETTRPVLLNALSYDDLPEYADDYDSNEERSYNSGDYGYSY
jgi:L-ascorbate peroxidase